MKKCSCIFPESVVRGKRNPDGVSRRRLYQRWAYILKRCYTKTDHAYKDYGAKGVKMCFQWQMSYLQFEADMGSLPYPKATIERKNTKGHYCPHNTKWATYTQQSLNKRHKPLGVTKLKTGGWISQITIEGKVYYLGYSKNKEILMEKFKAIYFEWYGVRK